MVRKNKLLIGCLTLLLVLSVGYALFSETITINGTATAKGSFDITTTCGPGYSDELMTTLGAPEGVGGDEGQFGFANSICNVNGNTVTMTTDLLYPTANRYFTVEMKNTGSIPAIIWGATDGETVESLDIDSSASWTLKNKDTDVIIKSGQGEGSLGFESLKSTSFLSIFPLLKFNATNTMTMDVIYDKEKQYAGIKLNPGEKFYYIIEFIYPEAADELMIDNGKSEYFEFKLNHEFKWEQYVNNPNYEDADYSDFCFDGC